MFISHVFLLFSNLWWFLNLFCFSEPWPFLRELVKYFGESPSIRVYLIFFLWTDFNLRIWGKNMAEVTHLSQYILPGVCDITMPYYWRGYHSSHRWGGLCLVSPPSAIIFPLYVINVLGEVLGDYARILFLLKHLHADISIHGWLLPTAMITMAFWEWFSISLILSTLLIRILF